MIIKEKTSCYKEELVDLRDGLKNMLPEEALAVFDHDAKNLDNQFRQVLKKGKGDKAPDFTLMNASGESISLHNILGKEKVVLVFYRGTWCPYCNLQLAHYQRILDSIKEAGASLVAISPQTPDESLTIQEKNQLKFEVLSDPGNQVAELYTSVFTYADLPRKTMKSLGIDFFNHYSDDSGRLPVPAVFIIDQDFTISYAGSEGGDYRNRVEASEILNALES